LGSGRGDVEFACVFASVASVAVSFVSTCIFWNPIDFFLKCAREMAGIVLYCIVLYCIVLYASFAGLCEITCRSFPPALLHMISGICCAQHGILTRTPKYLFGVTLFDEVDITRRI